MGINFYIATHFLTGIVAIIVGLLVFSRDRKGAINKSFGLLSLSVAVWSISYSFWLLAKDPETALFWSRTLNLGATFIPVTYLHWILELLKKRNKRVLFLFYILTTIFAAFSYTNLYIKGVEQILFFPYWPQLSWLYVMFLIFGWIFAITYSLYLVYKEIKISTGPRKEQLKYVFIGSIVGFIGGSTNYPLMMGFSWFPPIGSPLVIAYPIIFSYAMLKYRLMDIRIVITEFLVGLTGVVLLIEVFLAQSLSEIFLRLGIFISFCFLGYLLIRSVLNEIKRREELQKLYEKVDKLSKTKSEFISIASHQLRTPLTAVKGYISMIIEGTYGKPEKKLIKPLTNVYESNERLIRLVNDLLNLSRLEAGKIKMNPQSISLRNLVEGIINELKINAEKKNLYLKFIKSGKSLPNITADSDKLRQVILNVVDNAIKYTKEGGVAVEISKVDSQAQVKISDTGMGMNEKELESLFQMFTRATAGTQLHTEGAGIGLYVARQFIEMHEGKIWAESDGLRKGSRFYIQLPIK
ncbi:ATP-binding protein [Patescibacteria group bacterium]